MLPETVIFQDIDGPFIPGRLYFNGHRPVRSTEPLAFFWDPVAVMMVNRICEKSNAKVVFNTAHNENPEEIMRYQAAQNGLAYLHKDCQTLYPRDEYSRMKAIEIWLRNHPEINNWVCIDDMEVHPTNQVRVNFDIGMTLDDFNKSVEILTGKMPSPIISGIGTTMYVA